MREVVEDRNAHTQSTTTSGVSSLLKLCRMHVVNCHQNTEAADLLGGLRPVRGRDFLIRDFRERAKSFVKHCADAGCTGGDGDCEANDTPGGVVAMPLDILDVAGSVAVVQVRSVSSVCLSLAFVLVAFTLFRTRFDTRNSWLTRVRHEACSAGLLCWLLPHICLHKRQHIGISFSTLPHGLERSTHLHDEC